MSRRTHLALGTLALAALVVGAAGVGTAAVHGTDDVAAVTAAVDGAVASIDAPSALGDGPSPCPFAPASHDGPVPSTCGGGGGGGGIPRGPEPIPP